MKAVFSYDSALSKAEVKTAKQTIEKNIACFAPYNLKEALAYLNINVFTSITIEVYAVYHDRILFDMIFTAHDNDGYLVSGYTFFELYCGELYKYHNGIVRKYSQVGIAEI